MSDPIIHPTATVEAGARIGRGAVVEPYAVIKKDVVLGERVIVKSHVHIEGHTTVGEGTVIFPSASIGCPPQAIKYKGERSFIRIGKQCVIRECATINSSLGEDTAVVIGDNCLIMAYCHVAHNSILGKGVVMSNNATLAGHVEIEDFAIIGGMTPIHQFTRIGCYAMVGGISRVEGDVPPYLLIAGNPIRMGGVNRVGLQRHGFDKETVRELYRAYRLLYRSRLIPEEALERIEKELKPLPEINHFVEFCRKTKRGLVGIRGVMGFAEEEEVSDMDPIEVHS